MNMDPGSWSGHLAAAIRTEMASQHHATEALAELLGVARTPDVRRLLDGDLPFDLVEVERIAAWLGIALSELLARTDERVARSNTSTSQKGRVMQPLKSRARTRLGMVTLVVSTVLAFLSLLPPADAYVPATAVQVSAGSEIPCGPGVDQLSVHTCAGSGTQKFSEGGCGFLQRCIYFNRTEQQYIISGSKWIVQAALCAASIGLGCIAAGLVVELAAQYLLNRGGICPTSRPRLRVQWFPNPQAEGCVA